MTVSKSEMTAISQFSVQFVFFLSMWNQVETSARRVLQLMLQDSDTAMAVAVEIGNRSLEYAILAGAKDPKFKDIAGHLRHFVAGYKILLSYRNYYVHSLLGVLPSGGRLLTITAKGQLKYDSKTLLMEDVEILKNHISNMIGYVAAIERELGATGKGLDDLIEAYQASLEKPEWPVPLIKNPLLMRAS